MLQLTGTYLSNIESLKNVWISTNLECRIRSKSSSLELTKSENGVKEWQGIGVHETCQLFLSCLDAMIGALLVWFCNVYSCSTICLEGQRGL